MKAFGIKAFERVGMTPRSLWVIWKVFGLEPNKSAFIKRREPPSLCKAAIEIDDKLYRVRSEWIQATGVWKHVTRKRILSRMGHD